MSKIAYVELPRDQLANLLFGNSQRDSVTKIIYENGQNIKLPLKDLEIKEVYQPSSLKSKVYRHPFDTIFVVLACNNFREVPKDNPIPKIILLNDKK